MTTRILAVSRLSGNAIDGQLEDKSSKGQKNLSFLTAQKMVKRFLACDRIITTEVRCSKFTIQELADRLPVNLSELELFIKPTSRVFYRKTAGKIALPLIKLYCCTKWAEDE